MNLLRGILLENMGLKLVALLLALVVYLHVYTDRPATMTVAFPVETTDLADSLAIVSRTPLAVVAELKGTGKQLIRLRLAEPRLRVSLAGVGSGHFQRSVTVDDLPMIAVVGLGVSRFVGPQMIEVQVDRLIERSLPVAATVAGEPPAGMAWSGAWSADPPRVTVRGPRGVLLKLDSLRLAPVHFEAGRETLRAIVGPAGLPAGCEVSPPAVAVRVPLSRPPR
jgi:YbbR domain-containing protein